MKKILKVLGILVFVLIAVVAGIAAYVKFVLPKADPAPDLTIERTAARIERGHYLANYVMTCTECHSERDWTKYAGPAIHDSLGSGSTLFDQKIGLPGSFHSKNLTPYHLGDWSDGEIFRAVTTGISKDGRALFPLMPYKNFGQLDKEDIYSVIAYIRTLPPIKKDIAPTQPDFPMNFIINAMPSEAAFTNRPNETNTQAYGKYMVTAAGCVDCHSKSNNGEFVKGREFAGGNTFEFPYGTTTSANITPHETTGIGKWSKEAFIARFKIYADSNYKSPVIAMTDFNTPMPWNNFARMKDSDLSAIYDYLRTVKPVESRVVKFVKRGQNQEAVK